MTMTVVNFTVADHWRRPTDVDDALKYWASSSCMPQRKGTYQVLRGTVPGVRIS